MKTTLYAGFAAVLLLGDPAAAAPLSPGKPAGVRQAIDATNGAYILMGAALVSVLVTASIVNFGGTTTGTAS